MSVLLYCCFESVNCFQEQKLMNWMFILFYFLFFFRCIYSPLLL
jgi:hypothetical protein